MTPLCTLLKSGADVLVQTFTVLVYRPSFLDILRHHMMKDEWNGENSLRHRDLNRGFHFYPLSNTIMYLILCTSHCFPSAIVTAPRWRRAIFSIWVQSYLLRSRQCGDLMTTSHKQHDQVIDAPHVEETSSILFTFQIGCRTSRYTRPISKNMTDRRQQFIALVANGYSAAEQSRLCGGQRARVSYPEGYLILQQRLIPQLVNLRYGTRRVVERQFIFRNLTFVSILRYKVSEHFYKNEEVVRNVPRCINCMCYIPAVSTASWCDVSANSWKKAESHAQTGLKVIEISPATSKGRPPQVMLANNRLQLVVVGVGDSCFLCGLLIHIHNPSSFHTWRLMPAHDAVRKCACFDIIGLQRHDRGESGSIGHRVVSDSAFLSSTTIW
ncbi:hypothetical protein ANN_19054 [Periplaneta americana]|uniref:Uncharacterized protein n=1 Tax=Periplaneta americana TaxID=6978 RepID=A0ABQ8SQF5_PERAM|nr:hypothetical protein ANN_19054 [Periplaneta americana]